MVFQLLVMWSVLWGAVHNRQRLGLLVWITAGLLGWCLCVFVVGSEWNFSKYIGPTYKPLTPHMTSVTKPLQGFIFILAVLFQDVRLVSFLWQSEVLWGKKQSARVQLRLVKHQNHTLCLSGLETWHKPCCKHQLPHWRNLVIYSFIFCICFVCIFRQVKCGERGGISAHSTLARNSKNGHFLKVRYCPA